MYLNVLNRRDSVAGLVFMLFGVAAAVGATAYPLGSAMRMGAGYFPLLLGVVLALLGAAVLLRSVHLGEGGEGGEGGDGREAETSLAATLRWRPALCVGAGVVAFAVLAPRQGLLLSIVVMTLLSGLASEGGAAGVRARELLGLSAVLAAFGVAVFSFGLGLPLPVLPA